MSTDLEQQGQPLQPSTPPEPTAPSFEESPELLALRERSAQFDALLERLGPYSEEVKWLVEHPDYAPGLVRNARSAYERMQSEQQPQIPDWYKADHEQLSKLGKLAENWEQQQKDAIERPAREWAARWEAWKNDPANDRFYKKLRADHPELKKSHFVFLAEEAAESNFAPLEQVFNENRWMVARSERPAPPPPSSRASAGDVGIPGPSTQSGAPEKTARERVIELERIRQGRMAS